MKYLSEGEWDCVRRYFTIVSDILGNNFREICLDDSRTRGNILVQKSSMHSDIDPVFSTNTRLKYSVIDSLLNETCPLYPESCNRRSRGFMNRVVNESKLLCWPGGLSS